MTDKFRGFANHKGTEMKKIKNLAKSIWQDESAQGATEYILLLAALVAVLILFKPKIEQIIMGKTNQIGDAVGGF